MKHNCCAESCHRIHNPSLCVLGQSEDESDPGFDLEQEGKGSSLINIAAGGTAVQQSDFFFGDGDIDPPFDYDPLNAADQNGQVQYSK